MISDNSHLFKIIMPIQPNILLSLLSSHPNQRFVDSIIHGFESGFWPSADADKLQVLPKGLDNHRQKEVLDEATQEFLRSQRDLERGLGRYSESFGSHLLPGMVAQPCFAVPKPGTSKLQLVNDHTAGAPSLNASIAPEDGSFRPDNLSDLGALLIDYYQKHGQAPAWLFKSDTSSVYRLLPCHYQWQARQATSIDGQFHIDRCCVFGNQASGAIWCAFYALVLWIGIFIKKLTGFTSLCG